MVVDTWSGLIAVVLVGYLVSASVVVMFRAHAPRPITVGLLAIKVDLIIWTFAYLQSYTAAAPGEKYLWLQVAMAAGSLFGTTWLLFTLASTDRSHLLSRRNVVLLAAPGVALSVAALTNGWHGLSFGPVAYEGGTGDVDFSPGVLYWLGSLFCYLNVGAATILHAQVALKATGRLRSLGLLAVGVTIPPAVVGLFAVFGIAGVSFGAVQVSILASSEAFLVLIVLFNLRIGNTVRLASDQAIDQMGDAVFVVDAEGRVINVNATFEKLFGANRIELLGAHISAVTRGFRGRIVNLDQLLTVIRTCYANPWHEGCADVVVKGETDQTWEFRLWPIRNRKGDFAGRVAVMRNVTEVRAASQNLAAMTAELQEARNRLEERVRDRTAELAILMASMSDGLVVLDSARRVSYYNVRASELLGGDLVSSLGQGLESVFAGATLLGENRLITTAECEQMLAKSQWNTRFEIATAGTPRRELTIDLFRIIGPPGAERGAGLIVRDEIGAKQLSLLKERERIAMDLHDGVIQSLYAVALGLAAQERKLETGSEKTRDGLRQARAQLSGVIQEIRNYIFDLRLQKLGEQGLVTGLTALAEELRVNALIGPELELDADAEGLLRPDSVGNLLHIVREATSNVIRHAGASQVKITLERTEGYLRLGIRDNGRGFDQRTLRSRSNGSGNGLRNMAERARAVGATLETISEPGAGTMVRLELPLSGQVREEVKV